MLCSLILYAVDWHNTSRMELCEIYIRVRVLQNFRRQKFLYYDNNPLTLYFQIIYNKGSNVRCSGPCVAIQFEFGFTRYIAASLI